MAVFGKLDDFDIESGDWTEYEDRLGQYFIANDIGDTSPEEKAKKRAILLTTMGAASYSLLRKLCAPVKPSERTFVELCKLLSDHQNPKPSVIVQRFRFNTRNRKNSESVSTYVAELRRLCEHCDYGDWLEDMLRDRIVCGIGNDQIQKRLLSESTLTYKKTIEISMAMESASRDIRDLHIQRSEGHIQRSDGYNTNKLTHRRGNHFRQQPHGQMQASSYPKKQNNTNYDSGSKKKCFRCGDNHSPYTCKYKDRTCRYCKKQGHSDDVCYSKRRDESKHKSFPQKVHMMQEHNNSEEESDLASGWQIYTMSLGHKDDSLIVTPEIDGKPISMELDTGSSLTVLPARMYEEHFSHIPMNASKMVLRTYTGEKVYPKGHINVSVAINNQTATLPLVIVESNGPALFGRNWFSKLRLDWTTIYQLHQSDDSYLSLPQEIQDVLIQYSDIFNDELGTFNGPQASIIISSDAIPKFHRSRSLPFALRDKVDAEITRLLNAGIIQPVKFSDWAAPVVPIVKLDGSIRLCGDYKLTVNQAAKLEQYPIPRIEDLFLSLSGGQMYTKLDMSHAYQQVVLDEESRKYTTINTHRGLFQYVRLPFGISSAPAIFQRNMENLLQGLPGVCVYLDDIILTGSTPQEHTSRLHEVLRRLSEANLRLRRSKCVFMQSQVIYLGHKITSEGLFPTADKVKAIQDAPRPSNLTEVKSFVGLVNYYCKFVPQLSTVLEPMYRLQRKAVPWHWGTKQESAFKKAKRLLQSPSLLVHYDLQLPLLLACDASPYGIGAVLSHRLPNGDERPIGYVSRTLTKAEKNYSQLEKEALALIFGVSKFHKYVYGRHFTLLSDHKPLQSLLNERKATPAMASARIQRWALILSAYEYDIRYLAGSENSAPDLFSRLPLPAKESLDSTETVPELVHLMETISNTVVTAEDIKHWTAKDPVLSTVLRYILSGWPDHIDHVQEHELSVYFRRRQELSLQDGCILWGTRIIVPIQGRSQLLDELHEGHPGMSRMKALARSFVWWPGQDKDIENRVNMCHSCQLQQNTPSSAPLQPWRWPSQPWSRLHIDYAGPFMGQMFLIVIDSYSKWIEVFPVKSATSSSTIENLRMCFATHGIPHVIVSDNGTQFTSAEFEEFVSKNNIKHIRVTPYHPSSNGLAERAVQIFKKGMKVYKEGSVRARLARFLLVYRRLPQTSTGASPAELLMGRRLRSRLDAVFPDPSSKMADKQQSMKDYHDKQSKFRQFDVDARVYVSTTGKDWLPGTVLSRTGTVTYKVKLCDGRIIMRHVDHVRIRRDSETIPIISDSFVELAYPTSINQPAPRDVPVETVDMPSDKGGPDLPTPPGPVPEPPPETSSQPGKVLRRSGREKKPTQRLIDEM